MTAKKEILKNDAIKEIYQSSRNPIYFIKNYCKIQHPRKGLIPFTLYDYQEESVKNFLAYNKNIVNKARQLGYSTLLAAFIVWLILFHKDKSVMVVSTKSDVAKNLIKKVKVMLKHVPDWMYLADITINQAHMIGLSNGSWVKSIPRSEDAGRSEALSLLVIDEAAHIRDMDELWKGLASTVATGGKVVALSTPKGIGNWFHQYYKEAASGENEEWHAQEVFWWSNPEYAEGLYEDPNVPGGKRSPWFNRMTEGWTRQQIAQELLTSFIETGDTFLEVETISYYEGIAKEPIKKTGNDRTLWIWKEPESRKTYIISADVASGTAEDFSTAIVLDPEDLEICAELKAKIPPDVFGEFLAKELGPMYNNALIIPENNSLGLVTAFAIKNLEYPNLAYIDDDTGRLIDKWTAEYKDINPGFGTNAKTRPIILQKMEEVLRKRLIKSYSKRLVNEMLSFVWENNKAKARKGSNDDLIMALAIGVWIRESFFQYKTKGSIDAMSLYSAAILNSNSAPIPGRKNDSLLRHKEQIKRTVKNQATLRLGDRVINLDWIYKL